MVKQYAHEICVNQGMDKSDIEIIRHVTSLADRYHGKQVRKFTGERYIVHPVRVMEMVRAYNNDIRVLCAALLHDVLEDTPVTEEEMTESLLAVFGRADAEKITGLVVDLTDIFIKSSFPRLNRRSRKNREATRLSQVSADAQTIKYADLIDNVSDIVRQDAGFARTYIYEAKKMLEVMVGGHPELRERAMLVVEESLKVLMKGTVAGSKV